MVKEVGQNEVNNVHGKTNSLHPAGLHFCLVYCNIKTVTFQAHLLSA